MHATVVGGDSLIGRALAEVLTARGWTVTVTTRRPGAHDTGAQRRIELDLLQVARVGSADLPQADVTFLCAAITGFAETSDQAELSDLVNVTANAVLAKEIAVRGGRIVFLSSSAVFDGSRARRQASDVADGAALYGQQKARAERALSESVERLAIVRLAKVFDPAHALIRGWIRELGAGRVVSPFHDLVTAPVSLDMAVELLCALATSEDKGVFQLSARRDVSYADIAGHIAHRLGRPPDLVAPVSALAAGLDPGAVPQHATLDSERSLRIMGLPPVEPLRVVDDVFGLTEAPTGSPT